jgi:adenine-specific DNA-methyltransferase
MINRYLGNKTVLLDEILEAIGEAAEPGDLVCDAFSGSLAVSLALKRAGYRVAANDINLFSSVIGRAFITNSSIPTFALGELVASRSVAAGLIAEAEGAAFAFAGRDGYAYVDTPEHHDRAVRLLALLTFLQRTTTSDAVDRPFRRSDFFDHYCEEGSRSEFVSSRGRTGRRRFFSSENARHIDAILNRMRQWRWRGLLPETLEAVVLSVVLSAIERVSNTLGTYHDFPRDRYDPRALRPMRIGLPALDGLLGDTGGHLVGTERDSLEFIAEVPEHAVIYIDPPYNFRQYTAYYFLHNVVCRYPSLADPGEYFGAVRYVRGQNPDDDFVSTFCKPQQFISSLATLIERAQTKTVVLSYFDGRNHWNDFKSECNGEGFRRLTEFFGGDLFVEGSLLVRPVERLNYQSYGGYKARNVREYLFVAEKL